MGRIFYRIIGIVFVLGVCVHMSVAFASNIAQEAQQDKFEYKKPMPDIPMVPDKEFLEGSILHKDLPFDDNALSYEVRLPKNWSKSKNKGSAADTHALSSKILANVGEYFGPVSLYSGFPSRFVINAVSLDYELTAEQWFLQYLLSNGYALQGVEVHDENTAEALFVLIDRDASFIVRAAAIKNGRRIVLAQYFMPIELWNEDKGWQQKVIKDFRLISPDDELVEKMKPYHFLDIAEIQYPESWVLRAPPTRSLDRMLIKILNVSEDYDQDYRSKDSILHGKIEADLVSVYTAKDIDDEADNIKARLKRELGLVLEDLDVFDVEKHISDDFLEKKGRVYRAYHPENELLNYEYWVTQMRKGDYYFYVTLLTPARKDDYYMWSRNTETYKLVLQHTLPQQGSLSED